MASKYLDNTGLAYFWGKLKAYFQPKLVSGTNIKTINNTSILGSGNITIEGGSGSGTSVPTANATAAFDASKHMNSEDMSASDVSSFVDNLDLQGSGVVEYIIEQGTSGIWTYRKWNSGVIEMWGNAQSLTVSGGYYAVPLPFAISDSFYPIVNVTGWYGTDANRDAVSVYQTYGGIVNNNVIVYVRTSSGAVISSGYGRASIYLYGRWR